MSNSNPNALDCIVKEIDGRAHIRWGAEGQCYRLRRLATAGAPLDLPSTDELLSSEELSKMERVLVFGERSGGGQDFFDWVCQTLGDANQPWVLAQGHGWQPDLIRTSEDNPYAESLRGPESFLDALASKTPAKGAQKLVEWTRKIGEGDRLTILIRDLARLPENRGAAAAQAIRIAAESSDTPNRLRFLLLSTSEYEFEDTYISSGLAPMSDLFRLPWLNKQEIEELARAEAFGIELSTDTLTKLMDVTGGQPLLVQTLLASLSKRNKVTIGDIRREFRALRNRPPSPVGLWQDDLRARLRDDPALANIIRDYIAGHSRSIDQGIPNSHIHLFYPGWIRFDREIERWKISSKLHAEYAHTALSRGAEG